MVIFFFYKFTFSKIIIASLFGVENDQCNISNPCDFSTAELKISENDILFIKDNYTDDPFELKRIQHIFQHALDIKCTVVSNNMTINGSLLEHNNFSFIINNRADECQITGFLFTEFRSSIFCLRGVKKIYISDCYFINNSISENIGLLIITFSTCKIARCSFYQNIVHKTSMISILSSFCIIECCNISFNTISCLSNQGLILSSNSNCDFVNVTTSFNQISNSSPLFQFEWRSYIAFYNSTFINNYYKHIKEQKTLMKCDGICEIALYESNVINNNCSIIKITTDESTIILNTVNISFNQAENYALFDVLSGVFTFSMPSIIENNSFLTFADFHNKKSEVLLSHAHFSFNNSTDSFISIDSESSIGLSHSSFYDNYFPNGIIKANNIELNSYNNGFVNNYGPFITCQNCSTKIFSDIYVNCTEIPILNLTSNNSSTTVIFGSYFSNKLLKNFNQIALEGKSLLLMLRFENSYVNTSSFCFLCYYNQKYPGIFTVWTVLFSYSLYFIIFFLIVRYFSQFLTKNYFIHFKND